MTNHKLKKWRKERGLSQEALGKLIGVTKASVSRYEQGRVPEWPVMLEIVEISKCEVTPNDWLPKKFLGGQS
jgi:transcriptional regulator with XRE-family HTH domain